MLGNLEGTWKGPAGRNRNLEPVGGCGPGAWPCPLRFPFRAVLIHFPVHFLLGNPLSSPSLIRAITVAMFIKSALAHATLAKRPPTRRGGRDCSRNVQLRFPPQRNLGSPCVLPPVNSALGAPIISCHPSCHGGLAIITTSTARRRCPHVSLAVGG